jgi:quercetin dioxygenase-like cupin family protein
MTHPLISLAGEGEIFAMEPGSLVRFKILSRDTDGLLEMYERELPPRTIGADPHLHRTTTETFYVVSGHPSILCGSARRQYAPGSIVVVPPGTVHAYDNTTDAPVKVLICFTPGLGHEEFFRELSVLKAGPSEVYQERLDALRRRFDSTSVTEDPESSWEPDVERLDRQAEVPA